MRANDSEPTCPICGGTGYVTADVPIGHPNFGKAIPCECQTNNHVQRRIERLRTMSHLGDLTYLTFDTFLAEPTHLAQDKAYNLRRAFETCSYYAEQPDGWLLLTGTYGCGKTHLAAAIAVRG